MDMKELARSNDWKISFLRRKPAGGQSTSSTSRTQFVEDRFEWVKQRLRLEVESPDRGGRGWNELSGCGTAVLVFDVRDDRQVGSAAPSHLAAACPS